MIFKKYILEVRTVSLEVLFKDILSQIKKWLFPSTLSPLSHTLWWLFMNQFQLPQAFINLFHQLWKSEILSRVRATQWFWTWDNFDWESSAWTTMPFLQIQETIPYLATGKPLKNIALRQHIKFIFCLSSA